MTPNWRSHYVKLLQRATYPTQFGDSNSDPLTKLEYPVLPRRKNYVKRPVLSLVISLSHQYSRTTAISGLPSVAIKGCRRLSYIIPQFWAERVTIALRNAIFGCDQTLHPKQKDHVLYIYRTFRRGVWYTRIVKFS